VEQVINTQIFTIFPAQNTINMLQNSVIDQRSPTGGPRSTDGPRENFSGPWRNLDIAVTSLEPRIHKVISNKQQQISH
jgi:hypothetical protein